MATLWCMPEEEPAEPWFDGAAHPPSPVRVIEITAQVRAHDEAERAERERARLAAVVWRKPEALHAADLAEVKLPVDYRFEVTRRRSVGREIRKAGARAGLAAVRKA